MKLPVGRGALSTTPRFPLPPILVDDRHPLPAEIKCRTLEVLHKIGPLDFQFTTWSLEDVSKVSETRITRLGVLCNLIWARRNRRKGCIPVFSPVTRNEKEICSKVAAYTTSVCQWCRNSANLDWSLGHRPSQCFPRRRKPMGENIHHSKQTA